MKLLLLGIRHRRHDIRFDLGKGNSDLGPPSGWIHREISKTHVGHHGGIRTALPQRRRESANSLFAPQGHLRRRDSRHLAEEIYPMPLIAKSRQLSITRTDPGGMRE